MKINTASWQYKLTAYMASMSVSVLGSTVVSLAMIWYITLKTGSGAAIAGVTATTYLPQALLMLPGGALADRLPQKKIVIISDLSTAFFTLMLAVFFFLGIDSVGWLLFFNALRSCGAGLQFPASRGLLTGIVPPEQLMRANSISTGIWSAIQLISPALGGLVMSRLPMQGVFMIDVVTAAIGMAVFSTIPVAFTPPEKHESGLEGIKNGLRYIAGSKTLRRCILLYSAFEFLVMPASQLTALLASVNIRGDVWLLSAVETAFAVGALACSAFMTLRPPKLPHFRLIGISAALFGAVMLMLLGAKNAVVFAVLMAVMGMGSPLYFTPLTTHIQENADEEYIGRTFSISESLASLVTSIGIAIFGPLANVSLTLSFAVPGALLLLLGAFAFRLNE